jgi:sugar phosphate isomerase/epimerase
MTDVYVSSSCVRSKKITEAVARLRGMGFRRIEFSGGTDWYPELLEDLAAICGRDELEILFHNYFPPPPRHFVVNLASLRPEIFAQSLDLLSGAVRLSSRTAARLFGFHAGFLVDIDRSEIGHGIARKGLFDRKLAIDVFVRGFSQLAEVGRQCGVRLYIENNVYSARNHAIYGTACPFLLTCYEDYLELRQHCEFDFLLDLAHLKVSCQTLGLGFEEEFSRLAPLSDYWHISENDGQQDSNKAIDASSSILQAIKKYPFRPKIVTVEVGEEDRLLESVRLVANVLDTGDHLTK